jgi:Capsule polysaccharide biosynthesis protein
VSRPFVLVSEARGEFLVVERIRAHMQDLGQASVHVTVRAGDVSAEELRRSGAIALEAHPKFEACRSGADVRAEIDAEEQALGVNLRRIWQADLRSWRQGVGDDQMARLALGYLAAWRETLAELGEIAGLWGEDGGHLAKRTGFVLGEQREIPMAFVYVAPLPGRLLVIDNPLNRFSRSAFDVVDPTDEDVAYATEFLEDLRGSRIQFATPRDMRFGPKRVARFTGLLVDRYFRRPPGGDQLYPLTFARAYARQRVARRALRSVYQPLDEKPFVFHPIHAGFDAQISVRAPQWENQLALIEHVARSLPYGYGLAIKEHPFEVGALPLPALRRLLRRRPEIRLLDPAIHAHSVLRRCSGVTTINSTAGFEALFFQRPVITYGHGPYRGLGLTRDVKNPFDSPTLIAAALRAGGASDETLIKLVTFLRMQSSPGVSLAYDVGEENARRHAEIFVEVAQNASSISPL